MLTSCKLKLDFNLQTMTFPRSYPPYELSGIMTEDEFEEVIDKINQEYSLPLRKRYKNIVKWFRVVSISSFFFVGIFLIPVLCVKGHRQIRAFREFYHKVEEYLRFINRKKFTPRNVQWRIVKLKKPVPKERSPSNTESRTRSGPLDVTNGDFGFRLEIIYEKEMQPNRIGAGSVGVGTSRRPRSPFARPPDMDIFAETSRFESDDIREREGEEVIPAQEETEITESISPSSAPTTFMSHDNTDRDSTMVKRRRIKRKLRDEKETGSKTVPTTPQARGDDDDMIGFEEMLQMDNIDEFLGGH